ncbi:MAG: hypothetical protein ACFCBW_11230, partial [Candidatus Competibacterales bacterium]
MAKSRPRAAAAFESVSDADLAKQAQDAMAAGLHREAIDAYKQLLKRHDQPEWRRALDDAYRARAAALAAKGMPKEAALTFESARFDQAPADAIIDYAHWLLKADQWPKLGQLYHRLLADGFDTANLEAAVGIQLLVDEKNALPRHL